MELCSVVQGDPEKTLFSNLCSTWGSRMIRRIEYQSKTFPNIVFLDWTQFFDMELCDSRLCGFFGLGSYGIQVWLPSVITKTE